MTEVEVMVDILMEVTLEDPTPSDAVASESSLMTIGATVPTGFEFTAAAEVEEKLGCPCRISKDRGKIYFDIGLDALAQVHRLRSVDNLFVVVQEFTDFPFKEAKEAALQDFEELAAKLSWEKALTTWELNNNLKKKKKRKKTAGCSKEKKLVAAAPDDWVPVGDSTVEEAPAPPSGQKECKTSESHPEDSMEVSASVVSDLQENAMSDDTENNDSSSDVNKVLKFRVTCNRAGDKHSFTSNEAARDFGGAVQEHFQWKADMTNFDVEVLLNISYNEMLVGIALTEESLHRRNITHFGPTTLRSTLAYGMLR
ncbi:hypothetical protein GDO78_021750 [Eleutherodactylus coqui]|uniref:THUMP domain-containing protein n=1 Tax=Eleutherodactylus coqui TaxID=57060 RepID=A0A8J6EGP5_ELECQ|nr:hypothetical protein GDO78_021750 [Eleutherodactylus coqui]